MTTTNESRLKDGRKCSCGAMMFLATVEDTNVCDGVQYVTRVRINVCPNRDNPDHDHTKLGMHAHPKALYDWDSMVQGEEARVEALVKACVPGPGSVVWLRKSLYHPDDQRPEDEGLRRYFTYERFSALTGIPVDRIKSWEKHRKIEAEPPTVHERAMVLAVWYTFHPKGQNPAPQYGELVQRCYEADAARQEQLKPVEKFVVIE